MFQASASCCNLVTAAARDVYQNKAGLWLKWEIWNQTLGPFFLLWLWHSHCILLYYSVYMQCTHVNFPRVKKRQLNFTVFFFSIKSANLPSYLLKFMGSLLVNTIYIHWLLYACLSYSLNSLWYRIEDQSSAWVCRQVFCRWTGEDLMQTHVFLTSVSQQKMHDNERCVILWKSKPVIIYLFLHKTNRQENMKDKYRWINMNMNRYGNWFTHTLTQVFIAVNYVFPIYRFFFILSSVSSIINNKIKIKCYWMILL